MKNILQNYICVYTMRYSGVDILNPPKRARQFRAAELYTPKAAEFQRCRALELQSWRGPELNSFGASERATEVQDWIALDV